MLGIPRSNDKYFLVTSFVLLIHSPFNHEIKVVLVVRIVMRKRKLSVLVIFMEHLTMSDSKPSSSCALIFFVLTTS